MIEFTKAKVILCKPELKNGYNKYVFIMQKLYETNVALDKDFQTLYDGFYRVRRSEMFRKKYFAIMEELKHNNEVDFTTVFEQVKNIRGTCEISFTSKLIHTLNPDYPIWDSVVTKTHFNITAPYFYKENKAQLCCESYELYRKKFLEYIKTEEAKVLVNMFDQAFPDNTITDIKKIDFILWQYR